MELEMGCGGYLEARLKDRLHQYSQRLESPFIYEEVKWSPGSTGWKVDTAKARAGVKDKLTRKSVSLAVQRQGCKRPLK